MSPKRRNASPKVQARLGHVVVSSRDEAERIGRAILAMADRQSRQEQDRSPLTPATKED